MEGHVAVGVGGRKQVIAESCPPEGNGQPSPEQAKVETMFPAIARYVDGYGYIEIGDQGSFGFVVRAIGYGGLDFEDDRPDTPVEALAALEVGLVGWFEE
jgi:hypothetical protein